MQIIQYIFLVCKASHVLSSISLGAHCYVMMKVMWSLKDVTLTGYELILNPFLLDCECFFDDSYNKMGIVQVTQK